jgi:hypothetical protein
MEKKMTNIKDILEHEINTERQLIEYLESIQDLDEQSKTQIRSRIYDKWNEVIYQKEMERS